MLVDTYTIEQTNKGTITIMTHKENTRNYRKQKFAQGWVAIYMLVPPELADRIKAYKLKLKVENSHLYKRI